MITHTEKGRLTDYGLSLGMIERWTGKPVELRMVSLNLWKEHGTYHVRAHDHDCLGRLFWDSFDTLTAARKRFDSAKRELKANV